MQQIAAIWITLVVAAFVLGASTVAILVVRRSAEPVFGALGLIALITGAWAFALISEFYTRLDAVVYALAFAVAAAVGGYALASTLLGLLARTTSVSLLGIEFGADTGQAALVILGEDEPASYDESVTATALDRLSDEGLLHASIAILPFLFMAQKARYRAAGGTSRAARQLDSLAEHVEASLSSSEFGQVAAASVEGRRGLEQAVIGAAQHGFRRIVVAEAVVGTSLELDRGKCRVDALRLSDHGVHIAYTDVLSDSDRIAALVATRILGIAGDATLAGVVLVGAAQPDTRSKDRRDFDEQESSFLNRVRMRLVERGLAETHVRIAWVEWRTPDVTSAVRHLAAMGCLRIVVSPACFPLDTIQSTLDIEIAVRQARLDPSVAAITLTGYATDPAFAEEIRGRALSALASVSS